MAQISKEQKFVLSFKERLEQLQCPYTEDVEDSWFIELLFRPGEPRIRLLHWLFAKLDSQLNDVIDPQASDSRMDSRLQRLLFVASTLGLCSSDDVEVVRGTASTSKQLAFLNQLIDLVWVVDGAEDPAKRAMQSPGLVGEHTDLRDQYNRDCHFTDRMGSRENIDRLFLSETKLLPPDLAKLVEVGWVVKGCSDKERWPVPDSKRLQEILEELNAHLERQREMLTLLTRKYEFEAPDQQARGKMKQTLKLVMSEFSQLAVGFSYCFDNELNQWCNNAAPRLTQLGPVAQRTHSLLQQFVSLLESLTNIRYSHTKLCQDLKTTLHQVSEKENNPKSKSALSTVESFQQCIHVLEQSLACNDGGHLNSMLASAVIQLP